jgi:hypothetical protein
MNVSEESDRAVRQRVSSLLSETPNQVQLNAPERGTPWSLGIVPRRVVSKVRASVPDKSSEVPARRLSWDSVRTSRRC